MDTTSNEKKYHLEKSDPENTEKIGHVLMDSLIQFNEDKNFKMIDIIAALSGLMIYFSIKENFFKAQILMNLSNHWEDVVRMMEQGDLE